MPDAASYWLHFIVIGADFFEETASIIRLPSRFIYDIYFISHFPMAASITRHITAAAISHLRRRLHMAQHWEHTAWPHCQLFPDMLRCRAKIIFSWMLLYIISLKKLHICYHFYTIKNIWLKKHRLRPAFYRATLDYHVVAHHYRFASSLNNGLEITSFTSSYRSKRRRPYIISSRWLQFVRCRLCNILINAMGIFVWRLLYGPHDAFDYEAALGAGAPITAVPAIYIFYSWRLFISSFLH